MDVYLHTVYGCLSIFSHLFLSNREAFHCLQSQVTEEKVLLLAFPGSQRRVSELSGNRPLVWGQSTGLFANFRIQGPENHPTRVGGARWPCLWFPRDSKFTETEFRAGRKFTHDQTHASAFQTVKLRPEGKIYLVSGGSVAYSNDLGAGLDPRLSDSSMGSVLCTLYTRPAHHLCLCHLWAKDGLYTEQNFKV